MPTRYPPLPTLDLDDIFSRYILYQLREMEPFLSLELRIKIVKQTKASKRPNLWISIHYFHDFYLCRHPKAINRVSKYELALQSSVKIDDAMQFNRRAPKIRLEVLRVKSLSSSYFYFSALFRPPGKR